MSIIIAEESKEVSTLVVEENKKIQLGQPIYIRDPQLFALFSDCIKILDTKGADYTSGNSSVDRLHNFRTAAADAKISMRHVWYVYAYKHWSSIKRYVVDGHVESEPLRSRVIDVINYMYLLLEIDADGKR